MTLTDTQIRTLLQEATADLAPPDAATELMERGTTIHPDAERLPRRPFPAIRIAAAIAATLGGLTVIATVRGHDASTTGSEASIAAFTPPGSETPLALLSTTPPVDPDRVVEPGTYLQLSIGDTTVERYVTVGFYEGHAVQMDCFAGGCTPFINHSQPSSGLLIVDGDDTGIWSWQGIPDGTAYVVFTSGDSAVWQRPVAGLAAFATTNLVDGSAVALDDAGMLLGSIGLRTPGQPLDLPPYDWTDYQALTEAEQAEIHAVINDATAGCLDEQGAWDTCVSVADDALSTWLESHSATP